MKSCEKIDFLFMHIQCATACSLEKVNLKFKLLYLRNYISYFNEICSIYCVNTHIQSLKVWLKSVLSWLKYSNFSSGLFLLAHPVEWIGECFAQNGLKALASSVSFRFSLVLAITVKY